MFLQILFLNLCIIAAIEDCTGTTDLGEGSILGFVTPGGRELICERLAEGQDNRLMESENVFSDRNCAAVGRTREGNHANDGEVGGRHYTH